MNDLFMKRYPHEPNEIRFSPKIPSEPRKRTIVERAIDIPVGVLQVAGGAVTSIAVGGSWLTLAIADTVGFASVALSKLPVSAIGGLSLIGVSTVLMMPMVGDFVNKTLDMVSNGFERIRRGQ